MTLSTSAVAVCCCKRSLAQLVEQPRILDRDDGLSGKVRDQLNLFIGKGTNFLAGQR